MSFKKAVPTLVKRALKMAHDHGFENSCLEEVGRFLRITCGCKPGAKIAEIGTGFGVGTAWIVSGMDSKSSLITVDVDQQRANLVRDLFAGIENVQVVTGDWKIIMQHGPFDYVFIDAKPAKNDEADLVIDCVNLNGMIVLDDFTPIEHWPDEWRGRPDVVREKWLNDERLLCMELRTSAKHSILVARRVK
jgi:predicted O-methyltransferase YrrM